MHQHLGQYSDQGNFLGMGPCNYTHSESSGLGEESEEYVSEPREGARHNLGPEESSSAKKPGDLWSGFLAVPTHLGTVPKA